MIPRNWRLESPVGAPGKIRVCSHRSRRLYDREITLRFDTGCSRSDRRSCWENTDEERENERTNERRNDVNARGRTRTRTTTTMLLFNEELAHTSQEFRKNPAGPRARARSLSTKGDPCVISPPSTMARIG